MIKLVTVTMIYSDERIVGQGTQNNPQKKKITLFNIDGSLVLSFTLDTEDDYINHYEFTRLLVAELQRKPTSHATEYLSQDGASLA